MTDKEAFDLIATHAIPCAQADGGPRQAPRVMNEAPKWTAIDEAMRWLNEVETVQGGANGPTIKLRAAILAVSGPTWRNCMKFEDWWDTTKAAAEAAERERTRSAYSLAVSALKEWKREFPEAWALVDQLALNQCERALGPNDQAHRPDPAR